MGRPSHSRALAVWINGQRVATWRMPARNAAELHYDASWVSAPQGRPLSLSLPFQPGNLPLRGDIVTHYFDNLLPDSEPIRRRLAQRYRSASTGAFDLLQQLGRDCVGAVQLLGEDESPVGYDRIEGDVLSEAQIERLLQRLVAAPGAMGMQEDSEDDLRLSIAGAQEKTALLWHQNQWVLPRGATPTTHIFKLPMGRVGNEGRLDMSTSVENEWLCLRILAAFGLRVPRAAILRFGQQKMLGVERFDRRLHPSGDWWIRLPQEDFCQVRGLPPQPQVRERRRPRHGKHLRRLARLRGGHARPARLHDGADLVLDAGGHRWPRQKFQHPVATARPVPPHPLVRRDLHLARHRPRRGPTGMAKGQAGDVPAWQEPP